MPETASQCAIMYKEEVQRGTLVCGILQPLCVLLESLKPAGRAEFRGSPWFSFRDVMMRHYYIHRYDIVQNCIAWFGATSDLCVPTNVELKADLDLQSEPRQCLTQQV